MKTVLSLVYMLVVVNAAMAQTASDTVLIKETSLNYLEGFYTNNFQRVEKAVHPELAKRIIVKDEAGNFMLRSMGATELIFNAKKYKKPEDKSNQPFQAVITIFDISKDIAIVKATQNKMAFFDYLQLGKINGEWKIINVLWARTE